jgi:hypothetical protein
VSGRCRNNKRFLNVVNRKAIDTREVIFPRAVPYYAGKPSDVASVEPAILSLI